jgi:hypothetical protein
MVSYTNQFIHLARKFHDRANNCEKVDKNNVKEKKGKGPRHDNF